MSAWIFPHWSTALWWATTNAHNTSRRHKVIAHLQDGHTWWRVSEVTA